MRIAVILGLLVACTDPVDVAQPVDECEMPGTSWCVAVGSSCSAASTPFCDHGSAWCSDGICRDFCSAVDWPRCPAGELVHDVTYSDGSGVCVCVPTP